MLQPKTVPPKTLANLLPPNRDYSYFAGAGQLPFKFASTQYELANASWLAEASLLAYADEVFVRAQWARGGIGTVRAFQGASTQCYVASTSRFAIVAFRGTQVLKKGEGTTLSEMLRDWEADAKAALVDWNGGGAVHKGFKDALEEVWDDRNGRQGLKSYLDELAGGQTTLWFTGHSLGAALATLAAHRHGRAAGLYTFGSPRVGDRSFAQAFRLPAYRFVNATDIVTLALVSGLYSPARTPPIGFYEHVGSLKYIQSDGALADQPGPAPRFTDWLRGTLRGIVPGFAAFADHAPLFYAIHIWNLCVQAHNSKGGPS